MTQPLTAQSESLLILQPVGIRDSLRKQLAAIEAAAAERATAPLLAEFADFVLAATTGRWTAEEWEQRCEAILARHAAAEGGEDE